MIRLERWELVSSVAALLIAGFLIGWPAGAMWQMQRDDSLAFTGAGGPDLADSTEADLSALADYVLKITGKDREQ